MYKIHSIYFTFSMLNELLKTSNPRFFSVYFLLIIPQLVGHNILFQLSYGFYNKNALVNK